MSTTPFTAAEGRKFGLTVGAAFLVLAAVAQWRGHATSPVVLAVLGGALLVGGLLLPAHLGPVYRAWMGMAKAISKVTTPIFMGVVYFLVLTPTGLIMRAFGKDPLKSNQGSSGWVKKGSTQSDLTRQF